MGVGVYGVGVGQGGVQGPLGPCTRPMWQDMAPREGEPGPLQEALAAERPSHTVNYPLYTPPSHPIFPMAAACGRHGVWAARWPSGHLALAMGRPSGRPYGGTTLKEGLRGPDVPFKGGAPLGGADVGGPHAAGSGSRLRLSEHMGERDRGSV